MSKGINQHLCHTLSVVFIISAVEKEQFGFGGRKEYCHFTEQKKFYESCCTYIQ